MSNQNYAVSSVQRALDYLSATGTTVTLPELQRQLSLGVLAEAISKMIKTVSDNYMPISIREGVLRDLDSHPYILEMIPRIALGRRRGHSSAIVQYIQDNPNDETVVVVHNHVMLDEFANMLSMQKSNTGVLHYNRNVSIVTQSWFKRGGNSLSLKDPLVILDTQIGVESYLKDYPSLASTRFIVVGN